MSLSNLMYCIKYVTVCDHPEQFDGHIYLNQYFTLCVTELVVDCTNFYPSQFLCNGCLQNKKVI